MAAEIREEPGGHQRTVEDLQCRVQELERELGLQNQVITKSGFHFHRGHRKSEVCVYTDKTYRTFSP